MRSHQATRHRAALAAPLAVLGLLAAAPAGASAATTTFDAAAAKLTVNVSGLGAATRISRTAGGAIQVDSVNAGAATVTNTDTIAVTGASGLQQVVVDLSGGAFAPGKTAESGTGALSDIEFTVDLGTGGEFPLGDEVRVVGRGTADTIRFTGKNVLLNGDSDADVTTTNVEVLAAEGRGGDDRLLGDGDGAGGAPASLPLRLEGGDGADELTGGDESDTLEGGAGDDIEQGGNDADTIKEGAVPNGADTLDGGGSPFDRIDYSQRTGSVRIDLDDVADDGASGEADDVRDSFEYLAGGSGADAIVASQTRFSSFVIAGGAGNDTITGGDQFDDLAGGEGNDTIDGHGGSDEFHAGPGNDIQRGGDGADDFNETDAGGPNGADDIIGGAGVDEIDATGRTDALKITLADNTANDGGAGEGDNIHSDVEQVTGGLGADTITGAAADNYLNGGGGNATDTIDGGAGNDTIYGRFGDDNLAGSAGNDMVSGDDGNDTVNGGNDADEVRGGDGADKLAGGFGADKVMGDRGDDYVNDPSVRDSADLLIGGEGTDTVSYSFRATPVKVSLDGVANDGDQTAPAENDNVIAERVIGSKAGDHLIGSDMPDALEGGAGPDTLDGLAANDILLGGGDADVLNGGADNDTLNGLDGADKLNGDAGEDLASYEGRTESLTVTVGAGADDGAPGEGDDVSTENVLGGSGPDQLTGDDGANKLNGAAGKDTLEGRGGADTFTGGTEVDTVTYAARSTPQVAIIGGGINSGADTDNDGFADEQDDIESTVENVIGGSAGDKLTGDGGDNALRGGGGNDRLDGGAGADYLDGQAGRDTVTYGPRSKDVYVNAWDQFANDGEAGEGDRVTDTNEVFLGGGGNDTLIGTNHDDLLDGGVGADTLDGGPAGFAQPDGNDVLVGGPGRDTASYYERIASDPVKVTIDGVANDGKADGTEKDDVQTDVENLIGGFGNDELIGSGKDNVLYGGLQGDDVLRGEGGDDRFDDAANPPNFHVEHDEFFGGTGVDLMDYSKRTTTIHVTLDDVADDGVPTTDGSKPEADNVHSDVENVTTGTGQDIVVGNGEANRFETGTGGDRLEGRGGEDLLLGGADVDRLLGGDDNDTLISGPGNDVNQAGAGDDAMIEGNQWDGNDGFDGGPGRDLVDYSARTVGLVLDNDGVAGDDGEDANHDGVAEEKDRIATDVERLMGGSGADKITDTRVFPDRCAGLYGGPGQDVLTGSGGGEALYGGTEGDTLNAGGGVDYLIGGDGNDVENGGDGEDTFVQGNLHVDCGGTSGSDIARGDGADVLNGGSGEDVVEYRRTAASPLKVSLDGVANDGAWGEGDKVTVEDVAGGSGDDVIIGSGGDNDLYGDDGDDRIEGRGGSDRLWDTHGTDTLLGGDGGDDFRSDDGDNADTLDGGSGSDGGQWDAGDTRTNIP